MPRRTVSQKEHAYSGAANFTGVQDRIMEHGTLLWAFNEGPGRKKDNRLVKNDEGYKLPFDKEKQLSEDFAFLAARTDDSRYVVAVAIEEDEDDSGITIRLAMNEGNLEIIKSGFEKIANILQRAALREENRKTLQPELFAAIIDLDLARILSRLRSIHTPSSWKVRGRIGVANQLAQHFGDATVPIARSQAIAPHDFHLLCIRLTSCSGKLEAMRDMAAIKSDGIELLQQILKTIAQIIHDFDIANMLRTIKNMDPNTIEGLPERMHKLARYYNLSTHLLDAARDAKCPGLRNIRIATINSAQYKHSFAGTRNLTFDDLMRRSSGRISTTDIMSLARKRYTKFLSNNGLFGKVHAEVQLLAFYEESTSIKPPRLLAASKSACYLCNAFICLHGKFQISSTHGRLWPHWTLPDPVHSPTSGRMLTAAQQLDFHLVEQIKKNSTITRKFAPPNESVIGLTLPWSPQETLSVASANNLPASSVSTLKDIAASQVGTVTFPSHADVNLNQDTSDEDMHSASQSHLLICTRHEDNASDQRSVITSLSSAGYATDGIPIHWNWHYFKMDKDRSRLWFCDQGLDIFFEWDPDEQSAGTCQAGNKSALLGVKCQGEGILQSSTSNNRATELSTSESCTTQEILGRASITEPLRLRHHHQTYAFTFQVDQA